MIKTYVEFIYPGSFFSESSILEVDKREVNLADVPKRAFGYHFFDRQEVESDGELLIGKPRNESKSFLIGKFFSNEELKQMYGRDKSKRILLGNLESYPGGVYCRTGNWQPLLPNTEVIEVEVSPA